MVAVAVRTQALTDIMGKQREGGTAEWHCPCPLPPQPASQPSPRLAASSGQKGRCSTGTEVFRNSGMGGSGSQSCLSQNDFQVPLMGGLLSPGMLGATRGASCKEAVASNVGLVPRGLGGAWVGQASLWRPWDLGRHQRVPVCLPVAQSGACEMDSKPQAPQCLPPEAPPALVPHPLSPPTPRGPLFFSLL